MITLYNVISADGFIARKDGSEDFIPDELWFVFLDLCKKYGAVVIGRKTYEAIQKYEGNLLLPFEQSSVKKIVLTTNKSLRVKTGYTVADSLEKILTLSPNVLVSSGPTVNNQLLRAGLVSKVILCELPTTTEEGIEPFDKSVADLKIAGQASLAGIGTWREYDVVNH